MVSVAAVLIVAYLIGSIPSSIIASKVLRGIDLRRHGSGNAGATNAFRILGWKAGVLVLAADFFKGFAAAWWLPELALPFSPAVNPGLPLWAGCAAVAGHIWPLFAGFRGGKGVGTLAGVFAAIHPMALAICLGVFLVVLVFTRIVALGSLAASLSLPITLSLFRYTLEWPVADAVYSASFLIALLVVFTHRSNLRLIIAKSPVAPKPPLR